MKEIPMEVKASEIRVGDFLDQIDPARLVGPRGGRYRFPGARVGSRVARVERTARGLAITPSTGVAFVLPGNLADLTTAQVRRSEATEVGPWLTDGDLLAALHSDVRARRLAAEAELDRRTR